MNKKNPFSKCNWLYVIAVIFCGCLLLYNIIRTNSWTGNMPFSEFTEKEWKLFYIFLIEELIILSFMLFFAILGRNFCKKQNRRMVPNLERIKYTRKQIIDMMYDKDLDSFYDEVVRVVYSKDKSMRYVILKKDNGILTYLLEGIKEFDDEEWIYVGNREGALPARWVTCYNNWRFSHFAYEEDLMKELKCEPEFIQFFL